MDDGADSIDLLISCSGVPPERALVVVRNLGRGKDFSAFEASAARTAAVELGARSSTCRPCTRHHG
jgi:hypothetical protein